MTTSPRVSSRRSTTREGICGHCAALGETALPHRDNSRRSPCIGRSEKGARTCLIEQGDEQGNLRAVPRSTSHDRHLDLVDVEIATRARYESVIRLHVRPLLRSLPVAKLTGETGDAFQAGFGAAASTATVVRSGPCGAPHRRSPLGDRRVPPPTCSSGRRSLRGRSRTT